MKIRPFSYLLAVLACAMVFAAGMLWSTSPVLSIALVAIAVATALAARWSNGRY